MPNRFDDLFDEADAAFNGEYKNELEQLKGLTEEELKTVTPETEDEKTLNALIDVVNQATKGNMSQAELIDNIKALGDTAVNLAKKIPQFAALL